MNAGGKVCCQVSFGEMKADSPFRTCGFETGVCQGSGEDSKIEGIKTISTILKFLLSLSPLLSLHHAFIPYDVTASQWTLIFI